jgi:hypothetical protein
VFHEKQVILIVDRIFSRNGEQGMPLDFIDDCLITRFESQV